MGVKTTRVVKFIRKGETGAPGAKGEQGAVLRGPQAWSDCANGYGFQAGAAGQTFLDAVMYNGQYYLCKKAHAKTASNYPGSTTAINNGLWQLGDQIALVATRVLLAENAVIAGWVFRNNRLESQDGAVYLDGINGSARLNGILQLACANSGAFEDANIYYLPKSTTVKNVYLQADVRHVGKVIRMFNPGTPDTHANYNVHCTDFGAATDGSVSWEDMGGYNAVIRPQEWAEFTCIMVSKTPSETDASWELSGRFSQQEFINSNAIGRHPLALAMGKVTGSSSGASISGTMWNGKTLSSKLSVSRQAEGVYRISFGTADIPSGYFVILTGVGFVDGSTTSPVKATLGTQADTYFEVHTSDDASRNDGSFNFVIYSPNWQYSL